MTKLPIVCKHVCSYTYAKITKYRLCMFCCWNTMRKESVIIQTLLKKTGVSMGVITIGGFPGMMKQSGNWKLLWKN